MFFAFVPLFGKNLPDRGSSQVKWSPEQPILLELKKRGIALRTRCSIGRASI
jgi:hypothetical protein